MNTMPVMPVRQAAMPPHMHAPLAYGPNLVGAPFVGNEAEVIVIGSDDRSADMYMRAFMNLQGVNRLTLRMVCLPHPESGNAGSNVDLSHCWVDALQGLYMSGTRPREIVLLGLELGITDERVKEMQTTLVSTLFHAESLHVGKMRRIEDVRSFALVLARLLNLCELYLDQMIPMHLQTLCAHLPFKLFKISLLGLGACELSTKTIEAFMFAMPNVQNLMLREVTFRIDESDRKAVVWMLKQSSWSNTLSVLQVLGTRWIRAEGVPEDKDLGKFLSDHMQLRNLVSLRIDPAFLPTPLSTWALTYCLRKQLSLLCLHEWNMAPRSNALTLNPHYVYSSEIGPESVSTARELSLSGCRVEWGRWTADKPTQEAIAVSNDHINRINATVLELRTLLGLGPPTPTCSMYTSTVQALAKYMQ